jgi:hydroxyethylthiazole kinase
VIVDTAAKAAAQTAEYAGEVLARLRKRAPRVHCLTNTVAQAYTANMLLAAGAVPSMTVSPEEIGGFVGSADAVLINLGTLDTERRAAIAIALDAVNSAGKPWVLDPVMVERSASRAGFAAELLHRMPRAVRLNTGEFAALSGNDPTDDSIAGFAVTHGAVVAVTGQGDRVSDGRRRALIENGDPAMALVTAMGCAGSALTAAALAVEVDPFVAVTAAIAAFGVAGEVAALSARGPGSFAIAMIDALHHLDRATLAARIKASLAG